jgi:predicted protein tyrosine phosphatase
VFPASPNSRLVEYSDAVLGKKGKILTEEIDRESDDGRVYSWQQ